YGGSARIMSMLLSGRFLMMLRQSPWCNSYNRHHSIYFFLRTQKTHANVRLGEKENSGNIVHAAIHSRCQFFHRLYGWGAYAKLPPADVLGVASSPVCELLLRESQLAAHISELAVIRA